MGSYGVNDWLTLAALNDPTRPVLADYPEAFRTESQIAQPALTPLVADSIIWGTVPRASDLPPADLVPVDFVPGESWMQCFAIPRHGSPPHSVPTNWPTNQPLPGAINVSFFDGHGELVKLDRLWQLYWHKDYQPPAKRPGLP